MKMAAALPAGQDKIPRGESPLTRLGVAPESADVAKFSGGGEAGEGMALGLVLKMAD